MIRARFAILNLFGKVVCAPTILLQRMSPFVAHRDITKRRAGVRFQGQTGKRLLSPEPYRC
jgi:hypothetical protein